jgi:Kdo2-lipid IVA lauroyltransferase/acyltransferase
LEAAAFFAFIGCFRVVGLDIASAIGGFIGRNVFYRINGVMNRARDNLRAAFPEKSSAEIEAIVLGMCDNLGRTVAEYAHLDKFSIHGPDPRLEVVNMDLAERVRAQNTATIFFSGHFANWELLPFLATQAGFEGGEVYRPQNNPFVDRWLVRQRARNGTPDQVAKGAKGTRRMFSLLRGGKALYMLVDQKTNEGIAVPFFGRDAMTTPAPALLALKVGAILLPVSSERVAGSRFRIKLGQPINYTPSGDSDRDVYMLTLAITDAIEQSVRARPDQWLWIHRRWPTERRQDLARNRRALQSVESRS